MEGWVPLFSHHFWPLELGGGTGAVNWSDGKRELVAPLTAGLYGFKV